MWKSNESNEDIFEKTREMYNKLKNIVEDSTTRSKRKSSIVGIAHRVLIETFHRPLDRALQGVTKDVESGGSINYKVKINNPKRALKNMEAASLEKKDSRPKKPRIFDPEVHVVKVVKNQDSGSESGSLSDKSTATKIALTKSAILDALKEGVVSKAEIRKAMGWLNEVC
jgi:hypothetical protein